MVRVSELEKHCENPHKDRSTHMCVQERESGGEKHRESVRECQKIPEQCKSSVVCVMDLIDVIDIKYSWHLKCPYSTKTILNLCLWPDLTSFHHKSSWSGVLGHCTILDQHFVRNSGTFFPCVIFVELGFSWLGLRHIKNPKTINQMTS